MSLRRTVFAVACACALPCLAQSPAPAPTASPPIVVAPVAPPKCDKPEFPGRLAPDTRLRKWSADVRVYLDCLKAYVAERNAHIDVHNKAAKAAADDYNAGVKDYNEAVKSLND